MGPFEEWDALFSDGTIVDFKVVPDRSQHSAHEAQAMEYRNMFRQERKPLGEPRWKPGDTVRTRRDRLIDKSFAGTVMEPVRQADGTIIPNPRVVVVDSEEMWQYRISVPGRNLPISRVEKDLVTDEQP